MNTDVEELIFKADQGSLDAQLDLCRLYSDRESEQFDFDKAEKWLLRAIKKGSTYAKFELATLYGDGREDGLPLLECESDRTRLLLETSSEGHLEAIYFMCVQYAHGGWVDKSAAKSRLCLQRAADGGHRKARAILAQYPNATPPYLVLAAEGALYDELASEARAEARLLQLYLEKAKLGSANHQALVGDFYNHVEKYDDAIHWYELAATNGDEKAQFNLGMMLSAGEVTPKNVKKGGALLLPLAKKGDAGAMYQLAWNAYDAKQLSQALAMFWMAKVFDTDLFSANSLRYTNSITMVMEECSQSQKKAAEDLFFSFALDSGVTDRRPNH